MHETRPVARRGDPQTSWDAARSVEGLRKSQTRILALLLEYGPMDDEVIAIRHRGRWPELPTTASGLRTRRSELTASGMVVDTGRRVKTATGRASIVWRARMDSPRDLGGLLLDRSNPEDPEPGPGPDPVYIDRPDGF